MTRRGLAKRISRWYFHQVSKMNDREFLVLLVIASWVSYFIGVLIMVAVFVLTSRSQ